MWHHGKDVKALWTTMLAECDGQGFYFGSIVGLAADSGLTIEETQGALDYLMSPDPYSSDLERNPENKGRRVVKVEGGWRCVNVPYYNSLHDAEVRRAQNAQASKSYRERKGVSKKPRQHASARVSKSQQESAAVSPSDTTSSSDSDSSATKNTDPSDLARSAEPDAPQPQDPPAPPAAPDYDRPKRGNYSAKAHQLVEYFDHRLRSRAASFGLDEGALPDKLDGQSCVIANTIAGQHDPPRLRFAIWWAFQDRKYWHDQIADLKSLSGALKKLIAQSAEAWAELRNQPEVWDT